MYLYVFFSVTFVCHSKKTSLELLKGLNDEQKNRYIEKNLGKKSHRSRGRRQVALDNQMGSLSGTRSVKGL